MSTEPDVSYATDGIKTDVFVGGVEMAVRTNTRFSRTAHVPATDSSGAPIFDDDGIPKTKCGVESGQEDLVRKLVPIHTVANRDECTNCNCTDDELSERNRKGAGKASWVRRMRFGDNWGNDDD